MALRTEIFRAPLRGVPPASPSLAPTWRRRTVIAALATALSACVLVLYYATSVHLVPGTSDGATVVLEGNAMAHGNVALSGWRLSLDSFSLVDVPFYALGVLTMGLGPELLHLVPAVLALLTVAAAVALSCAGERGAAAIAGACTVAVLLVFPSPDLAYFLLQGPWHVGTALYCLLGFLALADGRFSWRFVLAVVLLAAGLLGDFFIVALGLAPVGFAALAAMARRRALRPGLVPLAAVLGSVALALLVRFVEKAAGTFTLVNRNLPLSPHQLRSNLAFLLDRVPGLFGVRQIPTGPGSNGPLWLQLLHVPGLVLVGVAVLAAAARLLAGSVRGDRLGTPRTAAVAFVEDCLVFGVLADLVLYVVASPSDNPQYLKYATPGAIFAICLAGRLVARYVVAAPPSWRVQRMAALLVPTVLFAAAFAYESATDLDPPAPQPAVALGNFLLAHHLTEGVGDYWSASLVTVETRGKVVVRPVAAGYQDLLRREDRQSADDWYREQHFDFLVYNLARPWQGVNASTATKTYGAPAQELAVGTYRVLVWRHPITVALQVPQFHSPLQLYVR